MKIAIRSQERDLELRLPTGLVLNWLTAGVASGIAAKNGIHLSAPAMDRLMRQTKACRETHPNWCLAEITSAKGESIRIEL